MSGAPQVTAAADKAEYVQGETVTVTFDVAADTRDDPRSTMITWTGHDDEGNAAEGTLTVVVHVQVADSFTVDSVAWEGGAAFDVQGMVATGTAP